MAHVLLFVYWFVYPGFRIAISVPYILHVYTEKYLHEEDGVYIHRYYMLLKCLQPGTMI